MVLQDLQVKVTNAVTSLECTGPGKRNGASLVFIRCVVLEIQMFFVHALLIESVVVARFRELRQACIKARKTAVAQE